MNNNIKKYLKLKLKEKLFYSELKRLSPLLEKKFPNINKSSYKKSLLVETRELNHNEFVIKNTIQKLGDDWGHIIYCHENNYDQIKSICDDISKNIEIRLLDFELNRNSYNNLCLDINFWNEIDCEKVLIYQTDSFIFKKFDDNFLNYDYLGATWLKRHSVYIYKNINWENVWGMNGGLSLRSVNVIKEILVSEKLPKFKFKGTDKITEDTFFSYFIINKSKYNTDIGVANEFSYEFNFNNFSFGCHKPWNSDFELFIKRIRELN